MDRNCANCGAALAPDEHVGRCKTCAAYLCECCLADYCRQCAPTVELEVSDAA